MTKQNNAQKVIDELLSDIRTHEKVHEMRRYIQHGRVSTYDHCDRVARLSYCLNRRFRLKADERTLLVGAMLHDFYLYDWHAKDNGEHRWHGFIHADRAIQNAKRFLGIGEDVEQVIRCHMWPLNITRIPPSREAWIVCLADKIISFQETIWMR